MNFLKSFLCQKYHNCDCDVFNKEKILKVPFCVKYFYFDIYTTHKQRRVLVESSPLQNICCI